MNPKAVLINKIKQQERKTFKYPLTTINDKNNLQNIKY